MCGCSSPASLCKRAKNLGYTTLALSDCNSLAGLWPFLAACKEYGIRPLVAAEITDQNISGSVICLVRNSVGYSNLCKLITERKPMLVYLAA